jgi:hypothetical protein
LFPGRSAFFGIVQVDPRLNIVAIAQTRSFLGCCQVVARFIPPAAFGKKGIPDGDFFFAWLSPRLESAKDINNLGQITGRAIDSTGVRTSYLAVPTP